MHPRGLAQTVCDHFVLRRAAQPSVAGANFPEEVVESLVGSNSFLCIIQKKPGTRPGPRGVERYLYLFEY